VVVRGAKYPRRPNEFYATPPETTRALLDNVNFGSTVVDPCCGNNAIIDVLDAYGYCTIGTDVNLDGRDFLHDDYPWPEHDVVTNPPFGIGGRTAVRFIERALEVCSGRIAMLLPVDFDSGITRRHLFGDCPSFTVKLVLLNRIRWFNGQSGSTNHAWFIWAKQNVGVPVLTYAIQSYREAE
jgi:hypothetical protein